MNVTYVAPGFPSKIRLPDNTKYDPIAFRQNISDHPRQYRGRHLASFMMRSCTTQRRRAIEEYHAACKADLYGNVLVSRKVLARHY